MKLTIISILSALIVCTLESVAQERVSLQGKVSYVTSANVYVKFENTSAISIGDTLKLIKDNRLVPCLVVKNKSSISCVAVPIGNYTFQVGDLITYEQRSVRSGSAAKDIPAIRTASIEPDEGRTTRKVKGGISAASYSTLSNTHGNDTKVMYRLSLSAPRINGSRFSFDTYMTYRQSFLSTDSGRIHPSDVFNIYNLAVRYDASPTMTFLIGRKISSKISSIGAIDGLQGEKYFGNFYVGVLAGFRPDITDYKLNTHLLQYGGYVGLKSNSSSMSSITTLGILQQTNSGSVDRRYAYFQHSGSFGPKVNVFSSFELDLYNHVNADSTGRPRLTNLYVLVRYLISRRVDFSLAYNSQKRILYYETLKTEIERLLDDDIARQGIRATANIRAAKYLTVGISYSKRFQANDLNKSDNINGYFTVSRVPAIGGRIYFNYNRNATSYSRSDIFSFRHSRTIINKYLDGDVYYRLVNYSYVDSEELIRQQYFGAALSYHIITRLVFDIMGEYAVTSDQNNYRINARLTQNF